MQTENILCTEVFSIFVDFGENFLPEVKSSNIFCELGSQVREVYIGGDQVDVPQHEVRVEIDDSLHADVGKVG